MWEKELEICKKAAVLAGKAILDIYNNVDDMEVEYKEENMPLTVADKVANDIILHLLKEYFPTYAVLSEEEKDNFDRLYNDFCFVVDPLDGTKEFIKRNGQFTVNIALAYKQRSVMGVIYVPVSGDLYYASEKSGAWIENDEGEIKKLKVSNVKEKASLRVVMSGSHGCKQMEDLIEKHGLINLVKIGSSLKGCLIAKGDAEVYYRYNPTMEWDTAAMQCIVEEAGGVFRQMDGSEMLYNRENSLNDKGFYVVNLLENCLE